MPKYEVVKVADRTVIVKEKTEHNEVIIKTFKQPQQAKRLCEKLNQGAGFQGWTPPFFLAKQK